MSRMVSTLGSWELQTQFLLGVRDLTAWSGRPGRVPRTRELVISNSPFVVAYRIDKEPIVILAIYHRAQQWPEVF